MKNTSCGKFSEAASYGLVVFPVDKGGKTPAVPSWTNFLEHESTPEELSVWDGSDFNIGIACGPESGIVVIDADSQEAIDYLTDLGLPKTPTVQTAKGMHYYFRHPGYRVRNRVNVGGRKFDVRGDRGYVVGAGSVHESGVHYCWTISPADVPFAELPPELLTLLAGDDTGQEGASAIGEIEVPEEHGIDRFLAIRLLLARKAIAAATEPGRNNTLNKRAFELARHVSATQSDWEPHAAKLAEAALHCGLNPGEIASTLRSAWAAGSKEPTPWIKISGSYVYLAEQDLFYNRRAGSTLRQIGFNGKYGAAHMGDGTFSKFLLSNGFVEKVQDITYHPALPSGVIQRDELAYFNTYRPPEVLAVPGDPTPFVEFFEYLVPEAFEREHFLKGMAFTVRNPGKKLRYATVLRSRVHGVGKSLTGLIWGHLLGQHNVRKVSSKEISSQFQSWIKENQLVICEELDIGMGLSTYNELKELITGDFAFVNEKHLRPRKWTLYSSLLLCTNLEAPLLVEDQDRRIFMIDIPAAKREPEYYSQFVQWLDENMGVVRWYLDQIDLSDFNPHAPPPMTAAKQALIERSRNPLAQEIAHHITERTIDKDIVTVRDVALMLSSMRPASDHLIGRALKELGCVNLGQVRTSSGKRDSLWAIRNVGFWAFASNDDRVAEFSARQGLFSEWPTSYPKWPGNILEICHMCHWPDEVDPRPTD